MSAEALHRTRQMTAIEAIVQGRFVEAQRIILELLAAAEEAPRRLVLGQCRYCACTDNHACAITVYPGTEFSPTTVCCRWVDAERTICSNVRCLERHRREHPRWYAADASQPVLP
jgi:hypothetical protein